MSCASYDMSAFRIMTGLTVCKHEVSVKQIHGIATRRRTKLSRLTFACQPLSYCTHTCTLSTFVNECDHVLYLYKWAQINTVSQFQNGERDKYLLTSTTLALTFVQIPVQTVWMHAFGLIPMHISNISPHHTQICWKIRLNINKLLSAQQELDGILNFAKI